MQETSSYLPSETPIIRHEWAFGKFQYFIIWPVSVLLLSRHARRRFDTARGTFWHQTFSYLKANR